MKKKYLLFLLVMVAALSFCLCGCGNASEEGASATETEDQYLDVDSVEDNAVQDTDKYKEKTESTTTKGEEKTESNTKQNSGSSTASASGAYIDEYHTEEVPAGEPLPVEPENVTVDASGIGKCTLLIECSTILENMADFNEDKVSVLPSDGIILAKRTVTFSKGESVFDVLLRETKNNSIHMEYEMTPIYNSNYIEGINNLYEFDCGNRSGWMYCVNDWYPSYGCSRYQVKEGDAIEWHYTCDLGRDLGETWVAK